MMKHLGVADPNAPQSPRQPSESKSSASNISVRRDQSICDPGWITTHPSESRTDVFLGDELDPSDFWIRALKAVHLDSVYPAMQRRCSLSISNQPVRESQMRRGTLNEIGKDVEKGASVTEGLKRSHSLPTMVGLSQIEVKIDDREISEGNENDRASKSDARGMSYFQRPLGLRDEPNKPEEESSNVDTFILQDWHTETPAKSVSLLEVFGDLIFVAIIIKMADMFDDQWHKQSGLQGKLQLLFETAVWHSAFFLLWLEMTCIFTRFVSQSLELYALIYLYLAGLVSMGLQIHPESLPSRSTGEFSLTLCVSLLGMILIHVHMLKVERALLYCLSFITHYSVFILLCLFIFFLSPVYNIIVLALIIGLSLFRTIQTFAVKPHRIPVNVHHMAERFGLFVLIFFGESIISEILPHLKSNVRDYLLIHFAFSTIFVLRIIYFELALHTGESHILGRVHALRAGGGFFGAQMFVAGHLPLTWFLLLSAAGYKLSFKRLEEYDARQVRSLEMSASESVLLPVSQLGIQLMILLLRQSHSNVNLGPHYLLLRMLVLGSLPAIPAIRYLRHPIRLVIAVFAVVSTLGVLDILTIEHEVHMDVANQQKHNSTEQRDSSQRMRVIRDIMLSHHPTTKNDSPKRLNFGAVKRAWQLERRIKKEYSEKKVIIGS